MIKDTKKKKAEKTKNREQGQYVDAIVFDRPDSRFLLQVTNIIAFYLECVHDFTKSKTLRNQNIHKAASCLDKFTKLINENKDTINTTGLQSLNEFMMEAESINKIIRKYQNSKVDLDIIESSILYSKLFRLQYILTMFRQGLK